MLGRYDEGNRPQPTSSIVRMLADLTTYRDNIDMMIIRELHSLCRESTCLFEELIIYIAERKATPLDVA